MMPLDSKGKARSDKENRIVSRLVYGGGRRNRDLPAPQAWQEKSSIPMDKRGPNGPLFHSHPMRFR
jgi:hypothetical protein